MKKASRLCLLISCLLSLGPLLSQVRNQTHYLVCALVFLLSHCVCSCVLCVLEFSVFSAPSVTEPAPSLTEPAPSVTEPALCSVTGQQRAIIERDDGELETRLRVSPTESALESDFVPGLDGWIFNGLNVIVLDHTTLENGSEFFLIQYEFRSTSRVGTPSKPSNRTVCGWLRYNYIRQLWS